jgi:glycosyltransferase involved in cell wall biosynthesis
VIFLSIVTRTFNRPVTLARLMGVLARQTNRDFEWVVVNDAGDPGPVDALAQESARLKIATRVVHNPTGHGRSFAANLGVERAVGRFAMLLDDDDYVSEEFVARMILAADRQPSARGLTCWSQVVNERIEDGVLRRAGNGRLYAPTYEDVSILGLFTSNIPTCGFVFRRQSFIELGGYPLGIECTEDWAFICKFVLRHDIEVLPEVLAYIGHRDSRDDAYGNTTSTAAGLQRHLRDEITWKNDMLRETLGRHDPSGLLILLGSLNLRLRGLAYEDSLHAQTRARSWAARVARRLGLRRG